MLSLCNLASFMDILADFAIFFAIDWLFFLLRQLLGRFVWLCIFAHNFCLRLDAALVVGLLNFLQPIDSASDVVRTMGVERMKVSGFALIFFEWSHLIVDRLLRLSLEDVLLVVLHVVALLCR